MKRIQLQTMGVRVNRIAAAPLVLFLALAAPAVAQMHVLTAVPAGAAASAGTPALKGVKVLARVPLDGQPVVRMHTQWESGRTYLYIEHGGQQLTTVDVTRKLNPKIVNHEPGQVASARYEELAEGGSIEVSQPSGVNAGFDNVGGRGMFSTLEGENPSDAQMSQAFGHESSNLIDPDRKLIFFASPAQLLIVQDGRWRGMDYSIN